MKSRSAAGFDRPTRLAAIGLVDLIAYRVMLAPIFKCGATGSIFSGDALLVGIAVRYVIVHACEHAAGADVVESARCGTQIGLLARFDSDCLFEVAR